MTWNPTPIDPPHNCGTCGSADPDKRGPFYRVARVKIGGAPEHTVWMCSKCMMIAAVDSQGPFSALNGKRDPVAVIEAWKRNSEGVPEMNSKMAEVMEKLAAADEKIAELEARPVLDDEAIEKIAAAVKPQPRTRTTKKDA